MMTLVEFSQKTGQRTKNILTILLLTAVVVCGAYLRFQDLNKQSYWMDEGYTINAVLSVQEKGVSLLDSGYTYFCPLYCYPTAWFATIFGTNAFSYRLLSVLAGIFFILLIYGIARKFFDQNVALLASFFTAFSYWQIAWSRQARWYTLFAFFVWIAMYTFYRFYASNNRYKYGYLFATLLFVMLGIITHKIAALMIPLFILWLLFSFFLEKKISFISLLSTIVVFIVGIGIADGIFHLGIISSTIQSFHIQNNLCSYLTFYGSQYWPFSVLIIVGLFTMSRDLRLRMLYILFPFIGYFIFLSFFTSLVEYRYLFVATPALYIAVSVSLFHILRTYTKKIFAFIIIGLFAVALYSTNHMIFSPVSFYPLESDVKGDVNKMYFTYTPQPNWNGAYDYIEQHRLQGEIVISSHPVFTKMFLHEPGYWLQYLNRKGPQIMSMKNGREYYVNAKTIDTVSRLERVISHKHGYLVLDYLALDNILPDGMAEYISRHFTLVYVEKTNEFSTVWVYRF